MNIDRRTLLMGSIASLALSSPPTLAGNWVAPIMPTTPETWVKPSTPILTANQAWENGCVVEPILFRPEQTASGKWEMLYVGGWHDGQIGFAICNGGNPENPAHWSKPLTAPVIGTKSGNFWASVGHPDGVIINGVYHVYFTTTNPNGANVWLATSSNPANGFNVEPIPVMLTGTEDAVMGNSALWVENGMIYNLYDANVNPAGGAIWKTYLAAAEVDQPRHMVKRRLIPSLAVSANGVYGGHSVRKVGRFYNSWFIGAPVGNTPSYIYHKWSQELINWGPLNGNNPVLTLSGVTYPADQIADPHVEDMGDHALMFYDLTHNPTATGSIWVAKLNAPLSAVCPA
jgi:hypothetical protein